MLKTILKLKLKLMTIYDHNFAIHFRQKRKNKRNQAIAEGGPRSEEKNVAEKGMKVVSGTTNPGFCTRGTCTICSGVSANGRLKSSIQEQAGLVNSTVA